MADILPVKGILFNPARSNPSTVTAPPYDIVSSEYKSELYRRDPHNIIRIDFGKDRDDDNEHENRYTRAAGYLESWLDDQILIHDDVPALYCYEITYQISGRELKTRGFMAAVRIEELGTGRIHPHEMTYSKPKSDRMNILRFCSANTSPIYSLYSSTERTASSILASVSEGPPFLEAIGDDGFVHRLWRITDSASLDSIIQEMSEKDIFIADGHHRYETALAFRKEMSDRGLRGTGEESFDYTLMFLANMEDEGLSLLPTHRIVEVDSDIHIKETLKEHFAVQKISAEGMSEELARQKMFEAMEGEGHTFGMFLTNTGSYYTLSFTGTDVKTDLPECLRTLDVSVLHKYVFEKLLKIDHYEYEMDPELAVSRAEKGSFEAVFFLNSTRIHDLRDVALAGERMPPKSTYFFPKLQTGMVIYKF